MPNIKSAKKELRKSKKLNAYNNKIKGNVKSLIKKAQKAIEGKDKKAKEITLKAHKALDKAARKGVINKNTKNRKKSRLHKKLNQIEKK